MAKQLDLDEIVSVSSVSALEGSDRPEEQQEDTFWDTAVKTVVAGGLAVGTLVAPAPAAANPSDTLGLVQQYAIVVESHRLHRQNHSNDTLIGLDRSESQNGADVIRAMPYLSNDIQSIYLLARNLPLLVQVKKGDSMSTQLETFVRKDYDAFRDADPTTQGLVLQAMIEKAKEIGREDAYDEVKTRTANYELHKDVFRAGLEALYGEYKKQKKATPKKDIVFAPSHKEKRKKASLVISPPATQPAPAVPAYNPCTKEELDKTLKGIDKDVAVWMERDEEPESISAKAKAQYNSLKRLCPTAGTLIDNAGRELEALLAQYFCKPTIFNRQLEKVKQRYEKRMANGEDSDEIQKETLASIAALRGRCPMNEGMLSTIEASFNDHLQRYRKEDAKKIKARHVEVGGNYSAGGKAKLGGGHLNLIVANALPEDPMRLQFYLDGGNHSARWKMQPYAGGIFGYSDKNLWIRLAGSGLWVKSKTSYRNPETITDVTTPLDDPTATGTQHTVTTKNSRGDDSTEGYTGPNGQLTAEGGFKVGKVTFETGFGYNRDKYHKKKWDMTTDSNSTDVNSHSDGPPAVDVAHTEGLITRVDTTDINDVITNLFLARAGVLVDVRPKLRIGADLMLTYSKTRNSEHLTVYQRDTNSEKVTKINIEGFPEETETMPGSSVSQVLDDQKTGMKYSQFRLAPRLRVLYDGRNFVLRAEMGPILGGDESESHYKFRSNSMPVAGNLTALFNGTQVSGGGNVFFDGDKANIHGLLNTGDFNALVAYVDLLNQLRTASPMDTRLRERYLSNAQDIMIGVNNGFLANIGISVDGNGNVSFNPLVAYTKQTRSGPYGVSLQGRTDELSARLAAYIGLGRGVHLRAEGMTAKDRVVDKQAWGGELSLVYHR